MLMSAKMSNQGNARTKHQPSCGRGTSASGSGVPAAIPARRTALQIDAYLRTTFAPALREIWFSNRETQLLESDQNPYKHCIAAVSNREKSGSPHFSSLTGFRVPVPRFAAGTHASQSRYSPPNGLCYSHRRTRVPPKGSRATAPARPSPEASRCCGVFYLASPRRLLRRGLPPIARGDLCARSHAD
jgi:hypothetical protein